MENCQGAGLRPRNSSCDQNARISPALGWWELPSRSYVPGYHLALAHIGLGNRDAAFERLARAAGDRDPSIINVAVEPRFEPLRRDPR